jgi:SAM-dependent methyltransferase
VIANTPEAWSERATLPEPHEAALWSHAGQMSRFAVVVDALQPQRGERLLDYGCGTGALADELPPDIGYVGYDPAPGMIGRAQADHPSRTFTTKKPTEKFTLTCCIGPFNLPDRWSKPDTWIAVRRLWRHTTRALAVCLYAGADTDCLIYTEEELRTFAATLNASCTIERHRPNDLLLVLRH